MTSPIRAVLEYDPWPRGSAFAFADCADVARTVEDSKDFDHRVIVDVIDGVLLELPNRDATKPGKSRVWWRDDTANTGHLGDLPEDALGGLKEAFRAQDIEVREIEGRLVEVALGEEAPFDVATQGRTSDARRSRSR